MATWLNGNVIVNSFWASKYEPGMTLREVHPVYTPNRGLIDELVGYAVCWVNPHTKEGALCEESWTRDEALEVMSKGGHIYSGHRYCPGRQLSRYLEKALKIWAPDWDAQIDAAKGPSSWSVNIYVREGRVFADNIEIKECGTN